MDLSLIIACYNEENLLENSIEQVFEILDCTKFSYEIIFVDDCSKDRTREIIDEIIKKHSDKNIKKIFHEKNIGRGGTVTDGFKIACGDVAGYIDIDLEVHARYIPSFVLAIKKGADIAIAYRIYKFKINSLVRYILSKGYINLVKLLFKIPFNDTEAGFKFFKREKLLPLLDEIEDKHWFWDTEFVIRAYISGLSIKEIPCLFIRRLDKISTVHEIEDTIFYLKKLFSFKKKIKTIKKSY